MIHVEMYDGRTFCEEGNGWPDKIPSANYVPQDHWHAEPHQIQRATCPNCLLRIFMLGDSASIALAKMGMKVDVRNEVSEEHQS